MVELNSVGVQALRLLAIRFWSVRLLGEFVDRCPEGVDFSSQGFEIAGVVDDVSGPRQSVLTADLAGDSVTGIGVGHPPKLDQPLYGHRNRNINNDRRLHVVARIFAKQGEVEHDDVVGVGLFGDLAANLVQNCRVGDPVQIG